MAIICDYKSPRGYTISNAYCKIITLGINEFAEHDGSKSCLITVGIWNNKEERDNKKSPVIVDQILITNGYRMTSVMEDPIEHTDFDDIFGSNVLSEEGINPVLSAYNHVKTLERFTVNQVDA